MACRLGMQAAHRVGRRRDARFGGIRGSRRRSVWSRCNGCVARPTLRRTTLHSAVAAASGSLLLRFRPASCGVYLRMRTTLISCAAVLTLGCGEPAGPHSTSHTLSITASETWTLAESPHVVHGRLSVRGTLTIEAGATVLFADTSGLTFGKYGAGSLRAQGSASAPIVMRGMDTAGSPGAWIGLTFLGSTPSEMHHVSVSSCGRERTDSQPPGCLVLGSRFIPGDDPTLLIDHVTVQDAAGGAVILQRESRLGAGSQAPSVPDLRGHIATLTAGGSGGVSPARAISGGGSRPGSPAPRNPPG